MLKKFDQGPAVVEFQEMLLDLGEHLPMSTLPDDSLDGKLGQECLGAASRILTSYARVVDENPNVVTDEELAFLRALRDLRKKPLDVSPPAKMIDRRPFASRKYDLGPRTWLETYGICLHQAACTLSASPKIERCDTVGAHFVVYPDGRVFRLHDMDRKIVHGHGWNAHTVGIEIDGRMYGIVGKENTLWDSPDTPWKDKANHPTFEQIGAVCQLIRWICAEVERHGGKMKSLVAHRQATSSRQNDPGQEIWQAVALPMMKELGLGDGGPGFKISDGYPIPGEWDPSRPQIKYGR